MAACSSPFNKLVVNQEVKQSFSRFTINLLPAGVRLETLEGRDYTVVPMVMLTEGVHAGSQGALYYPPEELSKTPVVWNQKPVVVYHPTMNGEGISACDPHIVDSRKVGVIMNTRYEGGKLKAEAWIERDRADMVDPRIMEAVDNKEIMELSTGVFIDVDGTPGKWKKENYDGVARNYRPDHLALLPDQIGACSVEDGAGLLRNQNSESNFMSMLKSGLKKLGIVTNEMSHDTKHKLLAEALTKRHFPSDDGKYGPRVYPKATYSNKVIYQHPTDGKHYMVGYKAGKNSVKLDEKESTPVQQVNEWRDMDNNFVGNAEEDVAVNNTDSLVELVLNYPQGEGYGGFLVTESDGTKHLPTKKNGALSRSLCGAAWAALHKGHRGNVYAGPNKSGAIAKLRGIYKRNGWDLPTENKAQTMNKDELIDAIIEQENGWEESDRPNLMSLNNAQLEQVFNAAKKKKTEAEQADDEDGEDDEPAAKKVAKNASTAKGMSRDGTVEGVMGKGGKRKKTNSSIDVEDDENEEDDNSEAYGRGGMMGAVRKTMNKQQTVEEYIAAAPEAMREVLNSGMQALNDEKKSLVKIILSNKANSFSKEDLNNKPLNELRNIARLAAPEVAQTPSYRFDGMFPTENSADASQTEVLEVPTMNFERRNSERKEKEMTRN